MSLNIELLSSSFAQIKDQETEFIDQFYTNLFADYPEVKPLFAKTKMAEQGKKLFQSLSLVVQNIRHPDILTNALKNLGSNHLNYGVLPEHYPMVGNTLIKVFSICLKSAWTPDTQAAWTEAYAAVTKLMLSGAEYPAAMVTAARK